MKLGMQVGLGPGHIVLGGDLAAPPPKGHSPPPIFGPYLLRPNGCMDEELLGIELGLGPGDCVRWGSRSPTPKGGGGTPKKFSAHIYCSQTAGWMKLVLGTEVGLSPGDFVLDGDPVLFPSPLFGPFLLWPNGCMHQNATWYGARPRPRRLCVRCGHRSPLP